MVPSTGVPRMVVLVVCIVVGIGIITTRSNWGQTARFEGDEG